ncbi:MAG TPA: hypothetical protein VLF94_08825 [Chlamydiales bacterium]|nr:hypothetical protein [Chlamydiales bacterium]
MPTTDTLNLLLSYLREAGPYVLASPEDAEYFRKFAKSTPKIVVPPPAPAVVIPSPPPAPPPAPVVVAPPPVPTPAPAPLPQPMPRAPTSDLSSVRNILSVVAPELALLSDIPSDAIARKISERWKTKNQTAPISILLFQEPPEQRALLEQIAKALDIYFGPAKIVQAEKIEKEKQWEAFLSVADLKMVIVCDYTLWQLNHLMHFYKETPAQASRTLGNVPLFLLPDLSLYLKDPLLKRSLWKALCQKFS